MNPAPSLNSNMYHVYLLRSKKNGTFYIGYSNDVVRRLNEHNSGLIGYTKKYRPWEIVYYESFVSLEDAKKREKSLKYFGKAYTSLKLRIKESLNTREGAG
ncbi:MAG: GIY-YIG nuclease family protein [Candidatus Omnitrophota bacterium]